MKPLLLLMLLLAGCGSKSDAPKKALVGAKLVDGTTSVIVIENGVFTAVGPSASVPDGFETINMSGKFIVPGLVDAHVASNADLPPFLRAGITSVGAEMNAVPNGPHVFPSLGKQPGIADLVVASYGSNPAATLAKIERMAKAEIAPLQIIQAATENGAAWLQQSNLGAIKPGQRADLLVLNADPLVDIKNLRQIYRVMLDGHWVETGNVK